MRSSAPQEVFVRIQKCEPLLQFSLDISDRSVDRRTIGDIVARWKDITSSSSAVVLQ